MEIIKKKKNTQCKIKVISELRKAPDYNASATINKSNERERDENNKLSHPQIMPY